jgi:hypothetical protein
MSRSPLVIRAIAAADAAHLETLLACQAKPSTPISSLALQGSAVSVLRRALATAPTAVRLAAAVLRAEARSKSAARAVVRDLAPTLGLSKVEAERRFVPELVDVLRRVRDLVRQARTIPPATDLAPGRRLPAGTPAERLDRKRRTAIARAARLGLRTSPHGHSTEIALSDDPAAVDFAIRRGKDWTIYRGAYKGWAATTTAFAITVPRSWLSRVEARGLAVAGGMMTLDAVPIDAACTGVEAFAATWVEQGRGYAATVVRGVIARSGTVTHHGTSLTHAVAGLQRKQRVQARVPQASGLTTQRDRMLQALEHQHGKERVVLADSEVVGNCPSGTRSWLETVGIDPTAGSCSLAEVVRGFRTSPRPEALAVLLHVQRRLRDRRRQAGTGLTP